MNAREARVRFHCTISLSLIARSISRRIWQQQQKLNAKTPRWQATDFLLLFNIMHLYCIITFFPYCTRMAPKLKKIEYTKFSGDIWYSFVYIINVYIRSWTMMTCKRHSSAKKKRKRQQRLLPYLAPCHHALRRFFFLSLLSCACTVVSFLTQWMRQQLVQQFRVRARALQGAGCRVCMCWWPCAYASKRNWRKQLLRKKKRKKFHHTMTFVGVVVISGSILWHMLR